MMQRITVSHLEELDHHQKEKLRGRWIPQEGEYIAFNNTEEMIYYLNGVEKHKSLPLLTIGQMIALLNENDTDVHIHNAEGEWVVRTSRTEDRSAELCHALWDAAKSFI